MTRARDLANVADDVSTGTVVTTASPSLGRRNLIINGGFDIWQRGTSFSAIGNNVFAPDRWYSTKVATGCTISRDTGTYSKYAMLITGDAANTAQSMTQRIEASTSFNMSLNDHTFSAKVYTSVDRTIAIQIRSATAEDDFSGNTLQQNTSVDLVTGWNTVNISVPSVSAYNLGVQLTLAFGTVGAGETVKVEQVQLEVGSVATPFEHRSYGEELQSCLRYFWQITGASGNKDNFAIGMCHNTTQLFAQVHFPVAMRIEPTTVAEFDIQAVVAASGYNVSFNSVSDMHEYGGRVTFNADSGTWTAGNAGIVRVADSASSFISFDAEL